MTSTPRRPYAVLFLCTGNSARSIIAEAVLRKHGGGRFEAYSAGSMPKGEVHPAALRVLSAHGYPVDGLRSKSWDEFAAAGAPEIDLIITVCDNAAGEVCPVWPGRPSTAHWGLEDPAAVEGEDDMVNHAFNLTLMALVQRIGLLTNLRMEGIDRLALKSRLKQIHEETPGPRTGRPEPKS